MKYRSRTEITAQILEAAKDGATKTKIMYKAFLSYAQLKEYLDILASNGLLTFDSKESKYRCTSKGLRFIDIHGKLNEISGLAIEDNSRVKVPSMS